MKYLLIDTANMFFRARHGAHRASDTWTKLGFALHVTMMAANKVAKRFQADHVVFALEGRSWRKDYYEPYKKNRAVARGKMTEDEAEEDKMFWETYDNLTKYLSDRTNCSVIRCATAEADDIIARWISLHPQDDHVVVAYPGVREKGTKNKVGLREAFADRDKRGYSWNNMMLQRWSDHNGLEHRVLDDYERNCTLIDLNAQPDAIKDTVDAVIREQISHKDVGQVGSHFLKFCGKYELTKCSDSAESFGRWLNETYKGVLNDTRQTSN